MLNKDIMITAIKDPFDPYNSRHVTWSEFNGKNALAYLEETHLVLSEGLEIKASLNGELLSFEQLQISIPRKGDNLVFCLMITGDDIVRTIATIVVIAAAVYFAPALGGYLAGAEASAASLAGWTAAAGATMSVAGMAVVNAILPPQVADVPTFSGTSENLTTESPTYGWNALDNIREEGKPWPVLYGTVRVFPYLLSRYIKSIDNKQRMYLLHGIVDHGVDTIADIEINENDVAQYTDITTVLRYGTNDQTVIPYFNDSYTETAVWALIAYNVWTERNVSGTAEAIVVGVALPEGLCYYADSGALSNTSVTIRIQYRPQDDSAAWVDIVNETLTDKTARAIRTSYRVDNLTSALYKVQMQLTVDPTTTSRYRNAVYLDYNQGVLYDDFKFPGASLLAVEAVATDQLSGGMPRVSALVTRTSVSVYTGSAWEDKPANNPAWAVYDMHVNQDYGGGVDYRRMNYSEFSDWADFCTTNSYTCNMYFDSFQSFSAAVNMISTLGRGQVVQRGTDFGVVIDKADTAVQLFGMNNIIVDSFGNSYLARKDRANIVEVSYFDSSLDYRRQSFELRSDDFDTDSDIEEKKISIILYGCTNKTMAGKYARFLLNCNKYFIRVVTFEVQVDSLASNVGDVIYVSHDVPQWGYSGRVIGGRLDYIQVDRPVTMEAAEVYNIMVRHSDDDSLDEVQVVHSQTAQETTDYLPVLSNFTKPPKAEDVYAFGKVNAIAKLFRITSISRTSDMQRRITALEYRAEVYSDTAIIPEYESESDLPHVAGLKAQEQWRLEHGMGIAYVDLSWRGFAFHTIYQKDNTEDIWRIIGTSDTAGSNNFEVRNLEPGKSYTFAVSAGSNPEDATAVGVGTKAMTVDTINPFVGHPPTPPDPTGLLAAIADVGFTISWTKIDWPWVGGYDIAIDTAQAPSAGDIKAKDYAGTTFLFDEYLEPDTYYFSIRSRDFFDQTSDWVNSSITVSAFAAPLSFSHTIEENHIKLTWSAVLSGTLPLRDYEIRKGATYATAEVLGTSKDTTEIVNEQTVGSYTYWVVGIDVANNYGTEKSTVVTLTAYKAPSTFTYTIEENSIRLAWAAALGGSFDIREYEVRKGSTFSTASVVGNTNSTYSVVDELTAGSYTYWVVAIDAGGNYGTEKSVSVTLVAYNAPSTFTSRVIDNNVLLQWNQATGGSLTLAEYEIRKGDVYATAEVVGKKKGTFTTVFELSSGVFTYWVVAIDVGDNYGTQKSLVATVAQPPDFVFNKQWAADFLDGTATNMWVDADTGNGIAPADATETWTEHFLNAPGGANSTLQDFITDGFTYMPEPVPLTAQYYEVFNYGVEISSSMITISHDRIDYNHALDIVEKIAYKNPGGVYSDSITSSLFALEFQYIRDKFDITAPSNKDFAVFTEHVIRLDTKIKSDAGYGTTDATGFLHVSFNLLYIDIVSLVVTPKSTSSLHAVVDFVDTPYPRGFDVYMFDNDGAAAGSIDFTWEAVGYQVVTVPYDDWGDFDTWGDVDTWGISY